MALLGLALVAGACGGGAAADSSSSSNQTAAERDAARLKFAQCMRENGVDLPDDPSQAGGREAFRATNRSKLDAAMKACEKYRQAAMPELTAEQRLEFQDAFVKFSACMREHGVEIPTPNGAGPGPTGADVARAGFDPDDPEVQEAMKACEDLRPQRGPDREEN